MFMYTVHLLMGRPVNKPNHPLVRLRKELSTDNHQMTRGEFSKKTSIPESTIKAVELDRRKLSDDMAVKIAFAFGVHPESLMGKRPLLDFQGLPFSKTSPKLVYLTPLAEEAQEQLCLAAWEVANKKRFGQRVSYCFERWLLERIGFVSPEEQAAR
jgi:hypothetical protein